MIVFINAKQERRSANAIMDYIVVPALPRKALVEWQVWIHNHNNKFECKHTHHARAELTILMSL